MKKLIIASGTGFLGQVLVKHFQNKFDQIVILSRSKHSDYNNIRFVVWDGKSIGSWTEEFKDVHTIINLTGKSVDCRYTQKNKEEILSSRLNAISVIAEAVKKSNNTPEVWINAASATIYGYSFDIPQTEESAINANDFSTTVCKEWEKCFFSFSGLAKRMLALRISIVFGNEGGVYPVLSRLVKRGLGGKQGNGKQMVSWIHTDDFVQIVDWLIEHPTKHSCYNCCSPFPITNQKLMQELRKKHKPLLYINSPEWILKIGAFFLQTETELVLKSRYVVPKALIDEGFRFKYEHIEDALKQLN